MNSRPGGTVRRFVAASVVVLTAWSMPGAQAASAQSPICPTEDMWERKRLALGLSKSIATACAAEGVCDEPGIRDAASQELMTIPTIVHVMRSATGGPPNGVQQAEVDLQMSLMNSAFAAYGVRFVYTTRFHDDGAYYCIPPFDPYDTAWYEAIRSMKAAYAASPATTLNLFVSCQNASGGLLGGMGTFPWDPDAVGVYGGAWVNAAVFGPGQLIAVHEVGHTLGLWHNFRGVSETAVCNDPCYESPHPDGEPAADRVGDFCSDTPATPVNRQCAEPPGSACGDPAWDAFGPTRFSNYMGYAFSCYDHFTGQQLGRMHCWTRSVLSGWAGYADCDIPPNPVHDFTATPANYTRINLAWKDMSNNITVFHLERDSGTGFVEIAAVPGSQRSYADEGLDCASSHTYRVRAENCGGTTEFSDTASATTDPCPPGTLMHIADVAVGTRTKGSRVRGEATVSIVDQVGAPVAGARVYVTWDGPVFVKQSALTNASGVASFATDYLNVSSYCFSLSAYQVVLSGATYYPNANVETSGEAGNACGGAP